MEFLNEPKDNLKLVPSICTALCCLETTKPKICETIRDGFVPKNYLQGLASALLHKVPWTGEKPKIKVDKMKIMDKKKNRPLLQHNC